MRRTLQLIACATAVWLAAPPPATADPIAITSGLITLRTSGEGGPITLTGTDGTRMFTFAGSISGIVPDADHCKACVSQISIDISAPGALFGTVTYGNESYIAGGGFLDTDGIMGLFIEGAPILLPPPIAIGEIRSFSGPFTASGSLAAPAIPGTGLSNTLTGSGIATVTLASSPTGNEAVADVWDFLRAEYRFSAAGGPAPVPEPATFLLFASGLSALMMKRRSRSV